MNRIDSAALDRYITGNWGEDQFKEEFKMIPADTDVTCPVCDTEFKIDKEMYEGQTVECDNCDATLTLVNGDLEELDEDITEDEDDEGDEDDTRVPIAHVRPTEPDDEGRK